MLLSLYAAAQLCGKHRSTLYRAVRSGRLRRDSQGRVDTEELFRLGYLSRSQADAAQPPRPPPTAHTRMLTYLDRLDAITTQLHLLIDELRRLTQR